MDRITSKSLVLEVGKSPELRAMFLGLAEMQTAEGERWFNPASLRWVEKIIACRAYGTPLLQACYLVVIAHAATEQATGQTRGWAGRQSGGDARFFWDAAAARSDGCRGLLQDLPEGVGRMSGGKFVLNLSNRTFDLTIGEMPGLVALIHFLYTALGYQAMRDVLAPLTGSGTKFITESGISLSTSTLEKVSSDLSKRVYEFLLDNLPAAQAQRRVQAMIKYMEGRAGTAFEAEALDDAAVLDYWDVLIETDGNLGSSFEAAFKTCLDLRRMLACGEELWAFGKQTRLGSDYDAGDTDPDPDEVLEAYEGLEESEGPLAQLLTPPADRVKALNKGEVAQLADMIKAGEEVTALPLSILRLAVFRPAHLKISQGLRRKLGPEAMVQLINTAMESDYRSEIVKFSALTVHLGKVMLATAAVLLQARDPAALTLASYLATAEELDEMKHHMNDARTKAGGSISGSAGGLLDGLVESGFMVRAANSLKSVNRQGYKLADLNSSEVTEGHAASVEPLKAITDCLSEFLDALTPMVEAGLYTDTFDGDAARFKDRFEIIFAEYTQ
jgi:hypothetical protein